MKRLKKILKWNLIVLLSLISVFAVVFLVLPKGPRDLMAFDDPFHVSRTSVVSDNYMAATGTPWATEAAIEVMDNGGNAFDAAAASLLMLNVTIPQAASFPGVAPLMIYDAHTQTVRSYIGAGTAPQKATIELFKSKGFDTIPKLNILAQLLPASPDVIIALLQDYGTMSFTEIAEPAILVAREGFPIHSMMLHDLNFSVLERIGFSIIMPYNANVYLKGEWWRPLHHKDRFTFPDLADTFEAMSQVEQMALLEGKTRIEALEAVRDYFYKGEIADKIIDLHQKKGGLFTKEDLANYSGNWEEPLVGHYNEYTFYANDTWSQGAVLPMALQILEGIDLYSMGHNSPQYIHTLTQAIELAMADKEAYFGDPEFVEVPIEGLLSRDYATSRRTLISSNTAFGELPPFGNPYDYQTQLSSRPVNNPDLKKYLGVENKKTIGKDTSYIAIIDRDGNAVSMTPSDFPESPMIKNTGLTLGIRMTQFRLDENHPSSLESGKRPTITPNASIVFKNGEFYMTFGTPGGDMQIQALVQVFLNHVVFDMDIQEAIEAPRFRSLNWPDSFAPHAYYPGVLRLEESLYATHKDAMEAMGYRVEKQTQWHPEFGGVCAIITNSLTNKLIGGADPRQVSWAQGK